MKVFFYGLFMDGPLLASKGITPTDAAIGYVDDFALHIGERATLLPAAGECAYGVVVDISPDEAKALYAAESVADYRAEPVTVQLADGASVKAACYNLPGDKVTGVNKDYAKSLLSLAETLGFPASYLDQIRLAGK